MKDKFFLVSVLTFVLLLGYNLSDAYSYPWFARRLVDNCNKCHVAFPKTNDYGQYVKTTGYELPEISYEGLEESPIRRFLRYFPVAARFEVDAINSDPADVKGDLTFREIQLISGGSILNNNVSWWFHKHIVESNNYVSLFDGTPHEMWGQYNLRFDKSDATRVNLRYGMSELPLRFSPSKTNVIESSFAIYNASLGGNSFRFSLPQYGAYLNATRLGGENTNEVKSNLSLGLVNGTADFSSHDFTQVFGRVSTTVSKVMLGAFTYVGSGNILMAMDEHNEDQGDEHVEDPPADHGDEHGEEFAEELMKMDNNFYRIGMDFDTYLTSKFNLFGLALYGRDSNPLGLAQAASGNYYGGFLGLDYSPSERLMLSTRFDFVRFGDLPAEEHADELGDEHGEEMPMDEAEHTTEAGGHGGHGELLTSNTDAMVFGLNFLPIPRYYQLRLTAEYRLAFQGLSDRLLIGFQYAL